VLARVGVSTSPSDLGIHVLPTKRHTLGTFHSLTTRSDDLDTARLDPSVAGAAIPGDHVGKLTPRSDVNRCVLQYTPTFALLEIDQIVAAVELLIEDGTEPETVALW
jgi:hypothetical protein